MKRRYQLPKGIKAKEDELREEARARRAVLNQVGLRTYTIGERDGVQAILCLCCGLGLSTDLFSPTFAIGRAPGWIAHCLEQRRYGRLIRPSSEYVGERGRRWVALEERG